MNFYNDPAKVDQYEKMCEEYDGTELYAVLEKHLTEGASLLELGCGPGNDIRHFLDLYTVTGSDLSDEFLSRCRAKFPDLPFVTLDAVSIETSEVFDCIYSNKVLHHLDNEQLVASFRRQQQVIAENGLFAHTFWLGDKEFTIDGMRFFFHDRDRLEALVSRYFTIRQSYLYKEFEEGDSVFILARNDLAAQAGSH